MRPVLFALLLLLASFSSFGQKIRFTDTANHWKTSQFDGSNGPSHTHLWYSFSGDTVINSITYRKMHVPSVYMYISVYLGGLFLVRDDTAHNMVYYRVNDTDYVLYNYNLHVGDTIRYRGNLSATDTSIRIDSVVNIDSVYYFGSYYKVFTLRTTQRFSQFSFTFIEGIGSFYGPMYPFVYPNFEQSEALTCFSRSGITDTTGIHYQAVLSWNSAMQPMAYYNNCNYLDVKNITSTKADIHISPNPCSYQTTITLSKNWGTNALVQIFDLTGRCLYSATPGANTDHLVINTSNFSAGVYIITVQQNNIKTNSKLVVE